MAKPVACCAITASIASETACPTLKSGAYNVLLTCLAYVTTTETDCTSNDAKITDIVTNPGGGASAQFRSIELKDKTAAHNFSWTYNNEQGQTVFTEGFVLETLAKNRATYCILKEQYLGQQVCLIWQEKGTDKYYMVGQGGGFYLSEVTGGTGTTELVPLTLTFAGEDIPETFLEIFITDAATTAALVASVTA